MEDLIKKMNETKWKNPLNSINYLDQKRINYFKRNIGQDKKVLEISGGNLMPYRFYYRTNSIYLVDISEKVIKNSRKYIKKGVCIDLNQDKLPFKNSFFDVIVAGEIIEHLFFPEALIKECYRVLKSGGLFIGSAPNAFNYRRRIEYFFGIQAENPLHSDHIRFFNIKCLKKLLSKYFIISEIRSSSTFNWFISLLGSGFFWKCYKIDRLK